MASLMILQSVWSLTSFFFLTENILARLGEGEVLINHIHKQKAEVHALSLE